MKDFQIIKNTKRILYSDDDDDVSLNMLHNTQSNSKNRRSNRKIGASASVYSIFNLGKMDGQKGLLENWCYTVNR